MDPLEPHEEHVEVNFMTCKEAETKPLNRLSLLKLKHVLSEHSLLIPAQCLTVNTVCFLQECSVVLRDSRLVFQVFDISIFKQKRESFTENPRLSKSD